MAFEARAQKHEELLTKALTDLYNAIPEDKKSEVKEVSAEADVIEPASSIEKIADEEGGSFTTKNIENTLHTQINFSGSNKNKVKIIFK